MQKIYLLFIRVIKGLHFVIGLNKTFCDKHMSFGKLHEDVVDVNDWIIECIRRSRNELVKRVST